MSAAIRQLGVEEEFQVVDLETRRLAPLAPALLERLPPGAYVDEMQRCVVEVNSGVFTSLEDLRDDLIRHRSVLVETARDLGLAVAAAGTMPLSAPEQLEVNETPRYRRMLADYQLLAREQLICGSQVHVDLPDRDEAVVVAQRLTPYLATFLALSASSPFSFDGADTGYASSRSLIWSRWPTSGPSAQVSTAAEYDALIADLVRSGVITDAGMVYFDVRPVARIGTLELRVCDSCPSVDNVVLIAGLFRAVVDHEVAALRSGAPPPGIRPTMIRAMLWQAARSGLEGTLVDPRGLEPKPAPEMIRALLQRVRPELEAAGSWELVEELTDQALFEGSSADRQRQARRRRGKLVDVVDLLVDETAGIRPDHVRRSPSHEPTTLLHGYQHSFAGSPQVHDEAIDAGVVRAPYRPVFDAVHQLGPARLREMQFAAQREASIEGATFKPTDALRAEVFPVDLAPRIITADDWAALLPGMQQRALALNAFIDDVYGPRAILNDEVVPAEVLDLAPGYRQSGFAQAPGSVRNHITGFDLVCTGSGEWLVMEDNLRVPSGLGYALSIRQIGERIIGAPAASDYRILDPGASIDMLRDTLRAAAPVHCPGEPALALLSGGSADSAWHEHQLLAERTGLDLVSTGNLVVVDRVLHRSRSGALSRLDVLYVRMDEEMLLSSPGADGVALRQGLLGAVRAGNLRIVNSLGNGVGDDKAVYAHVPAMVRYYLGEEPLLPQIPTYLCADREQRDAVLERLGDLVVKPIDGFGGSGITIGPESTAEAIDQRRRDLLTLPERYVAQEIVPLSTHPTFDGAGFHPHHVDLRVFCHLRAGQGGHTVHVLPAGLSRVAPRGSMIVNSSRGGGGKDTWILT